MSLNSAEEAIERYARGKPCMIRLPSVCSGNDAETVACHIKLMGYHGTSLKMLSLFVAFGCSHCHDVIDRRRYTDLDLGFIRTCALEGMIRTQAYIMEHAPELIAKLAREAA